MTTKGQSNFSASIEGGYQRYLFRTIKVDPGPNWKGYNLNSKQNGVNITSMLGYTFPCHKLCASLGFGYLNYEGIDGFSVFGDLGYKISNSTFSPLLNLRVGYSHIWNQYENGTGTMHTEFGLGLNYRMQENYDLYVKSGLLLTQQALLIPITLGLRL